MLIREALKEKPDGMIARAYRFAECAHRGQRRKTGDPYFTHAVAVAETLMDWRLDETSVVAGLLHDVVEDTGITLENIRSVFGDETATLIDGMTKLGRLKYRGAAATAENLRKLIFALSEDLRVIFIKLADRRHNMQTLHALPRETQKRIAQETEEIYAPIAYRLGMQNVSGELRDIAFPYLFPLEHRWLMRVLPDYRAARLRYLREVKPLIESDLREQRIAPSAIDFRTKRVSSLYQKLKQNDMDMGKIYDLVAIRIIVNSIEECYAALGIIHKRWPPLPGRIKDFIAMPKPNGYRSLHTTVIGPEGMYIEVQIRTQEMHEENENGIAAHWAYKQFGAGASSASRITKEIQLVQELRRWLDVHPAASGSGERDLKEFLRAMKVDFFKDRIFTISPHGDVIDLPQGATPVDFAYHIHSDVGNTCVGARVNDSIVPLNHRLESGDVVKIITQKQKLPSEDWVRFVKTSLARHHIKSALRKKGGIVSKRKPLQAELRVIARDRVGLFRDITAIIARSHINIVQVHTANQPKSGFVSIKILCDTADPSKVERLILKLKRLPEIKEIRSQAV